MASWNPFKREAETLKSISQEIQRSEAPTGAIGKLSTKVRSMIDAVASRIRSVVGGSSDVAKAAVLAAAGTTQMPAHAGQDFQPNQNIGNNFTTTQSIERDKGSPLIVTGGMVQDGDQLGGTFQLRTENADNSAGVSFRAIEDHAQLSVGAARNFGHKEGGAYTTTAGAQILIDRRDAESVFGSNVDGSLQGIQARAQSGTTFNNGKTTLDVGLGYKKTLDVNLGSSVSTTSTQSTSDTGATIDTIQTDTITTTQTVYKGKGVSDISLGGTQYFDNNHQAFSLSTKYRRTDGEPSELGSNVRYQIIGKGFGEEGRNRFSAQLSASDLGMKNPTYGVNLSHAVGPHGSIGIGVDKAEGTEPSIRATYSYSFDGNRAGNFSLPISTQQTPGNMVADMNNEGQNPNIFPYRQLGNLHNTTTVNQVSKMVSSITKTVITSTISSISLKAGETKDIEISVQGDAQPFVTTDGGIIAELIPVATTQPSEVAVGVMTVSTQDVGAKKFIVRITAPVDASRTNATVTVSAGNTKVDIPAKITGIINQAPVASSDTATTDSNNSVEIAVLKNDKDPEGQPLSIVSATVSPDEGSVLVTANNTISFTPKPGFVGTAVISYTAKDSQGALSNTTFVSVKVNAVIDPNAFSVAVSQREVILEPNSEASIGFITNARILSVTPLRLPSGIMVNFTPDNTPSAFALMSRARSAVAFMATKAANVVTDTPDQSIQVMTGDDVAPGTYTIRMTVVSESGESKIVTMNVTVQEKPDTLAPVLTLNGAANIQLTVGDTYTELGANAVDDKDGDISSSVQTSGLVDTNTPGTYTIIYTGKDKAGNASEITRTVVVQEKQVDQTIRYTKIVGGMTDASSFVITSPGVNDPDGYIATLIYTAKNKNTGEIVVNSDGRFLNRSPGEWEVRIAGTTIHNTTGVMSSIQQSDVAIYTIETPDTLAPTLTLNGAADVQLTVGDVYTELGAKALDNKDGDISSSVQMSGSVDTNTPGTHTIIYTVADKAGNTTSATRSVTVLAPKVDAPTTYAEPLLSVNQDTNTVSINNMGDLVKDLDGVKDMTVYLEANGVRIGNSQGLYANVLTSTSADVAYTISADFLTKNGVTGQYEPGTHKFTTKAVLYKEVPADPAPIIPAGSAFANLGDMTVSDEAGAPIVPINTGGIVDSLGRSIVYSATGLPDGLTIDANTGVIGGIYDANGGWGNVENNTIIIFAQPNGSSHVLSESFVLGIRNDG